MKSDNTYFVRIKIEDKELNEIMKKLEEAKRQIYECYNMLDELGAIRISKEMPPAATDGSLN